MSSPFLSLVNLTLTYYYISFTIYHIRFNDEYQKRRVYYLKYQSLL